MFTWLDKILSFRHDPIGSLFLRRGRHCKRQCQCKPRSLHLENLEQRQLLSALPVGVDDSYAASQGQALVVGRDQGLLANDNWQLLAEIWSLDLRNNMLIVPKPAGAHGHQTENAVRSLILRGIEDDQDGLHSSVAASQNANAGESGALWGIGYADAADLGLQPGQKFCGATISENGSVVVRFTYLGDANLDGKVDSSDWGRPGRGWVHGDFDYDGEAHEAADLALWQRNVSRPALPDPVAISPLRATRTTIESAHATILIEEDGAFVRQPKDAYVGPESFSYTVTNLTTGDSSTADVTVDVENVEPAVGITGLPGGKVPPNVPINLGSSVIDAPGDTFTYAWDVTKVANGITTEHFATATTAEFTFTPDGQGDYTVCLLVTDAAGATGVAQATILDDPQTYYFDLNGTTAGLGSGDGTWDTSTENWTTNSGGTGPLVAWPGGNNIAVFKGGTAGTVTISSTVTAGGIVFDTNGYTLSGGTLALGGTTTITVSSGFTATIGSLVANSGGSSGGIVKSGGGSLKLNYSGGNTYTGSTSVNAGTLIFASGGLGSSGAVYCSGGALKWDSGNTQGVGDRLSASYGYTAQLDTNGNNVTLNNLSLSGAMTKSGAGILTLTGNASIGSGATVNEGALKVASGGSLSSGGGVTIASGGASFVFDVSGGSSSAIYSGSVYGPGTFEKAGSGKLTYTGYQSGGPVCIAAGELEVGDGSSSNGYLNGNATVNSGAYLTFNTPWDLTYSGATSGGGSVTKSGSGTLTLSGGNSHSGGTSFFGGKVSVASASNLPTNRALAFSGGTLQLNGDFSTSGTVAMNGSGTIEVSGGVSGGYTAAFSGVVSGAGHLTKSGAGILTLSGSNLCTGGITINAGTLSVSGSSNLGSNNGLTIAASGTLQITGSAPVTNGITLDGCGTILVGENVNATISGTIGGACGFTKSGAGILSLSGDNSTYSPAVTIEEGTLSIAYDYNLGAGGVIFPADGFGTLLITASLTTNKRITLNGYGMIEVSGGATVAELGGIITGTYDLWKYGAGQLTIRSTAHCETAGDLVSLEGTLQVDSATAGGAYPCGGDITGTYAPTWWYVTMGATGGEPPPDSGGLSLVQAYVYAPSWASAVRQAVAGTVIVDTSPFIFSVVNSRGQLATGDLAGPFSVVQDGTQSTGWIWMDTNGGQFSQNFFWSMSAVAAGGPTTTPPDSGGCNSGSGTSTGPVRYLNGEIRLFGDDLGTGCATCGSSEGTRSYDNTFAGQNDDGNGYGWQQKEQPHVVQTSGALIVTFDSATAVWFAANSGGTYTPMYGGKDTLTLDTATHLLTMARPDGTTYKFFDFAQSDPAQPKGALSSMTAPAGQTMEASYYDSGKLYRLQHKNSGGGTVCEQREYTYHSGGVNDGRVESITLAQRASAQSNLTAVRKVDYVYYESESDPNGLPGDLKSAATRYPDPGASGGWSGDPDSSIYYYRYYKTDDANGPGFKHGLKRALRPGAYKRLCDTLGNPDSVTDEQIASYTCYYFEYDSQHRVTHEEIFGQGQAYSFEYPAAASGGGYNDWKQKTVETREDSTTYTVYTNFLGQVLLTDLEDSASNHWYTYKQYGTSGGEEGKLVLEAEPSAIDHPNLASGSGNWDGTITFKTQGGQQTVGLLHKTTYYADDSGGIDDDTPGGAKGYVESERVCHGNADTTGTLVRSYQYYKHTAGGQTIYPTATVTEYKSGGGSGGVSTIYEPPTWYSGANALQMQHQQTTLPEIPEEQNGSEVAASRQEWFDCRGNRIIQQDQRGRITYSAYDAVTGYLTETIQDLNSWSGVSLPEGLTPPSPPSGGGLHLVTSYQHDALGRVTQVLGPEHDVNGTSVRTATWTVYKDFDEVTRETWTAQGYVASGGSATLINPVSITKYNRYGWAVEELQATAETTALGTEPLETLADETFTQDEYTRWTKNQYSNSRLASTRVYHTIPASGGGSEGDNYNTTSHLYDGLGRQVRVKAPGGTITRTVYDARGLVVSTWMGTSDGTDPADWSPSDPHADGANMEKVSAQIYDDLDGDGDADAGGDGNLSHLRQPVDGTPANDRVTTYGYDWRGRQWWAMVNDGTYQTYTFNTYDNLGRVTKVEQYNDVSKDGVYIDDNSDGGGGNDDIRIAQSETFYDDLGRVYQTKRYAVDPVTGNVDANHPLVDNTWYDAAGNVIKSQAGASQAFTKTTYDGLGRVVAKYVGYDLDETAYGDADDLTGDTIFEQAEYGYNAAGQTIYVTSRQRTHTATGEGVLADADTQPYARVTYSAAWFDGIGRQVAAADWGAASSAPTRAGSPPDRADTVLVTSTAYNSDGEAYATTDPKGTVAQQEFDDAGRVKKTIQNYEDGTVESGEPDKDVTVQYTYTADGAMETMVVSNPSTGSQTTRYVYGTDIGGITPAVYRNDLLRAVIYPDSDDTYDSQNRDFDDNGEYDRVEYRYNRQGQQTQVKDQNETVHDYIFDALGRQASDQVSLPEGSSVDGRVLRIDQSYEVRGMVEKITSYNSASGGSASIVDQVLRRYDSWARLADEFQEHFGAVRASTPAVQYLYDDTAEIGRVTKGGRTHGMVYPNGRVVDYLYGDTDSVADALGRVSAIADVPTSGWQSASLENGSFSNGLTSWTTTGTYGVETGGTPAHYFWQTAGTLSQTVTMDVDAGDLYRLHFWAASDGTGDGLVKVNVYFGSRVVEVGAVPLHGTSDARWCDFYAFATTADESATQSVKVEFVFSGADVEFRLDEVSLDELAASAIPGSGTLVEYAYLGVSQILGVDYVEPDLRYDLAHQDANGQYDRMDAFGRIEEAVWLDYQPDPDVSVVEIGHGYDRAGNRLWRDDVKAGSSNLDELYTYDGMYQLTSARRGQLTSSHDAFESSTENFAQNWTLDATGNWSEFKEGPAAGTWTTLDQDRLHNAANEIDVDADHGNAAGASITAGTGENWCDPVHDAAGNMTTVPNPKDLENGLTCTYDAWNRMVEAKAGATVVGLYRYDGTGRRIEKAAFDAESGMGTGVLQFYYNSSSQVVEERSGFGTNGMVVTDFGSGQEFANAVAVQEDGKIVVVGYADMGTSGNFAIARYNPDGTLDANFGGDGMVDTDFGGSDGANAVAIQPDGKIVVAGYTLYGNTTNFAIARYNPDGTLDTSFSGDGKVVTSFHDNEAVRSVAIAPDGSIVVAGPTIVGEVVKFAVARYEADGDLDTAFSGDGKVETEFGSYAVGNSVAVDDEGCIVVAGSSAGCFALARYEADGDLDTTFDSDGKLEFDFDGSPAGAQAVALHDGKIVVAGIAVIDDIENIAVARLADDGEFDDTFGDGGLATADFPEDPGSDGLAMAIQGDGAIVVGLTWGGMSDMALARFTEDGDLDPSFGDDGLVYTDVGYLDSANGVALARDGRIIVAGTCDGSFVVAVYDGNGAPDVPSATQYVWSLRYVDDLVLRDDDHVAGTGDLGKSGSGLDRRLYAMQDANWNVVAIAEPDGDVVERYTYDAYGKVTVRGANDWSDQGEVSSVGNRFFYTGRERDAESGLYYYRARYYDADLGRFVGRDSIAADINLYRYCQSNPVARCDPSGEVVSYTTIHKALPGTCGAIASKKGVPAGWFIEWHNTPKSKAGGWIIQKVVVSVNIHRYNDSDADPAIPVNTSAWPLWEAWQVMPDQETTTRSAKFGQDDCFSPSFGGQPCTRGKVTMTGTAQFYEGLTLPDTFKATGEPPTGDLPATKKDPGDLPGGTGAITRTMTVTWKCGPTENDIEPSQITYS